MRDTLGFVTGLALEAAIVEKTAAKLRRKGLSVRPYHVLCLGMGPENAHRAAQELQALGAQTLVSFGCAGALAAGLEAGLLLLPTQLVHPEKASLGIDVHRHSALANSMSEQHIPFMTMALAGSADVVATPRDKRRLALQTGACAVDMESYTIAEYAVHSGLAFLAARVLIDPLDQHLPAPLLQAVGWDGRLDMALFWHTLVLHPELRAEAAQLRAQSRRCIARLRQAASALLSS
jgi:adenosylhomocysteine nucleosidase